MKPIKFVKDSSGVLVNVNTILGVNILGDGMITFGSDGYVSGWFKNEHSLFTRIKDQIIAQMENREVFKFPHGGMADIKIVGSVFQNPKNDNLIITSEAPKTSLFIATVDNFDNIDDLLVDIENSLESFHKDDVVQVDWSKYYSNDEAIDEASDEATDEAGE